MADDLATRSAWRQELAARDAAASRSSTQTTDSASSTPPPPSSNMGFTSRHDPKNGKKHKRAAKKAGKKAEAKEPTSARRTRLGEQAMAQAPSNRATKADASLGRRAEARAEFERAAGLTANEVERAHLLARAAGC